jgi:hypothetical protein
MLRGFAREFAARKLGPWTFIEPDCIPLRAGWHDEWEADYQRGGKPFMGGVVEVPGVPKHSTGNMVLPEDVADWCISLMVPQIADIGGRKVELAFDIAAANDILPRHHETKLIQHVFRGPAFETAADLARIDPRACLWHSDKDGGLIRLLRALHTTPQFIRMGSDVVPNPEFQKVIKEPEPPLVHTYFRPCDDPDALAEQKRILAIWERSWRAAGFEPVILTEAHAREHPQFEEYCVEMGAKPTINPPAYEMACWLRWMAAHALNRVVFLTDYDVLPFSFGPAPIHQDLDKFPTMLCGGVPCAVIGTPEQFEAAINAFVTCQPTQEQGQPHLSDMHAAQQLGFRSVDICREYGTAGWKEAKLIHFNHYSCNPRKRSECMEGASAERLTKFHPDDRDDRIAELERTVSELESKLLARIINPCTLTNGQTAALSVSPTELAKRRRGRAAATTPSKRSPEQQAADKARMAKVRAAKLPKA